MLASNLRFQYRFHNLVKQEGLDHLGMQQKLQLTKSSQADMFITLNLEKSISVS